MKIAPRQADAFLRAPNPAVVAVLLYGPDEGLVRERAEALVLSAAETLDDPFRVAEIDPAALRDDPARLADEAAALSLSGGRRAVRLRRADAVSLDAIAGLLALASGDSLVVVEAGDLPARSALRKAFESAGNAAALPCYRDEGRGLAGVIGETLRGAGFEVAPDATEYLVARLGGDRQATRRELEKLILYMGPPPARVTRAEAEACVGDGAALSLEDLAFAVGGGEAAAAERALRRSLQEGAQPVTALRAVAGHLQRLHQARGLAADAPMTEVMARRLRPPVFWKRRDAFAAQTRRWSPDALAGALDALLEAESACKRTAAPADAICGQALLAVLRLGAQPRGGHPARRRG